MAISTVSKDKHLNIRVKPNPDCAHLKDQHIMTITIKELGRACNNFPIAYVKNPENGEFKLVVLLGYEPGENLYYGKEQWKCSYAPYVMLRHPFIIGPDDKDESGNKLTICLEDDSQYVNETEGERLYNEDGSETDFLKYHQRLLGEIYQGEVGTYQLTEKLKALDLISPITLTVQLANGSVKNYTGLFTINETKLNALDKDQIFELHQAGYLPAAYMIMASMGQFNMLAKLRNQKGESPVTSFNVSFVDKDGKPLSDTTEQPATQA